VSFESFDDNAFQFCLRIFLPSMENRVRTITEMHGAINHKLNEAGIVIAFPQRGLRFDSNEPLRISIEGARQGGLA